MQSPPPSPAADLPLFASIQEQVRRVGHAFVPAAGMRAMLEASGSLRDWEPFAQSWSDLPVDEHMADHGRYRRRRHAVFAAAPGMQITRQPHRPHFQGLDYNPVNGGIERWFEPVESALGAGPSLCTILAFCRILFETCAGEQPNWDIEVHQFRIEAVAGEASLPTPEGMHRDGVDYVLVLLVRRCNIDRGTTMIGSGQSGFSSSFTLTDPFDAAIVDDHRVYHGVTPVQPLDAHEAAFRDVLVVTFRRA